jgi:hypothetical protein
MLVKGSTLSLALKLNSKLGTSASATISSVSAFKQAKVLFRAPLDKEPRTCTLEISVLRSVSTMPLHLNYYCLI